jgi:hypothetical protein
MINCKLLSKNATFGSESSCKSCGMNFGLSPVKIKKHGSISMYCCERCASI